MSEFNSICSRSDAKAPVLTSSLTRHEKHPEDAWYSAAVAVFKAVCDAGVGEAEAARKRRGKHEERPDVKVVTPLIILDGNLLCADLGEQGELELTPCDHIQLSFTFSSKEYGRSRLHSHIVTMAAGRHGGER
ncbi:MAG TPA: hypothetical protein VGB85_15985 [Nannocystis sp.]